jgi:hypothetical protein
MAETGNVLRPLAVHFAGGTEISIRTGMDPSSVYQSLTGDDEWLVIEDEQGERHYLSIRQIAYLSFGKKKGIGFSS